MIYFFMQLNVKFNSHNPIIVSVGNILKKASNFKLLPCTVKINALVMELV